MILVTGATGVSGSIIMREFARQNIPVRAFVRSREKAEFLENYKNIEICVGDLLKSETIEPALEGVETALLISSAFENMLETQRTFIDTAKRAGISRVVKYSGAESGIGFNAQNFRSVKEHENLEDYLVYSGLDWTILRPSQFMQFYLPGMPGGVSLKDDALVLPIENGKLSPVDIEDVAKVCVRLLIEDGHQNRIYEMTGPDALNMTEVCEIISKAINRKISFVNVSLNDFQNALSASGMPRDRIEILMQINRERKKCLESRVKLETHRRFDIIPTNFAEFVYKNVVAFEKTKESAA